MAEYFDYWTYADRAQEAAEDASNKRGEAIEQLKSEYDKKLRLWGCDFDTIDDICQKDLDFVFSEWMFEQLNEETVFAGEVFSLLFLRKGDTKELIANVIEAVDFEAVYDKRIGQVDE